MTSLSFTQDAVKADPQNYKVEFENDLVCILKIIYKPGEKLVIYGHSEVVAVFLTDVNEQFTLPKN